jgi:hypothetical protein
MPLAVHELPDVSISLGVGDGSEDKGQVALGLNHLFGSIFEAFEEGGELGSAFFLGYGSRRGLGFVAFLLRGQFVLVRAGFFFSHRIIQQSGLLATGPSCGEGEEEIAAVKLHVPRFALVGRDVKEFSAR